MTKIKEIKVIRTRAPATWVIVKVITDQPGLYGIGSAHDYNATGAVVAAIEEWMAPRLIGRDASRIEDIWQSTYTSGYWRTGPTHNAALAGIDIALWDIKGKEAGMPVYQLLGGPCRAAVPCYAHAQGKDLKALEEDVQRYIDDGWQVIRCQLGEYGSEGLIEPSKARRPKNAWPQTRVFDEELYVDTVVEMFEYLRSKFGYRIKLNHDVHEHLKPNLAVQLAKRLEPYRLFFRHARVKPRAFRGTHHIFLHQDPAKVIRAVKQRDLGKLRPFRHPAGLQMLNIIQHDAGKRNHPKIFAAGSPRRAHLGRLGLKTPRDERTKSTGPVLQTANAIKVKHPLHHRLAQAVNHRRR